MSQEIEKQPGDHATPAGDTHQIEQVSGGVVAVGRGAVATAVYQGLTTEQVADLLVKLKHKDQPQVWDGRIPYLGLNSFHESDAQFFFGRESLVDDLLRRVQQSNFIVIAGPSGSGKSSVARAGLFHALSQGALDKSETWLLATMRPQGNPLENLAQAMERATKDLDIGDTIRERIGAQPELWPRLIKMHLSDDQRQCFVLLVDQFEEIFTQTRQEEERLAFINLLAAAAQTEEGRTIIIISQRSDFVSDCARYPQLRALMSQQFQLVGAMDPPDLAKAITLPSLEVGAVIDAELVSRIMADMKGEPGALPLMGFALRDLFEVEKTKPGQFMDLTLQKYLDRGGIESALERHANKVFDDFSDEQKVLARSIFSKLIEVRGDHVPTRRTVAFQDLIPAGTEAEAVTAVVHALAKENVRLLTTGAAANDQESTPDTFTHTTVTIAHEKLIEAWPWLRQLVDDNRESIALQNQINADAQMWHLKMPQLTMTTPL